MGTIALEYVDIHCNTTLCSRLVDMQWEGLGQPGPYIPWAWLQALDDLHELVEIGFQYLCFREFFDRLLGTDRN